MPRNAILLALIVQICVLLTGCGRFSCAYVDPKLEAAYDDIIARKSSLFGLEPELVKAVVWKESRFQKERMGDKGEIGLMQLLPQQAVRDWARVTRRSAPSAAELVNPELNIEIGAWYLGWCGSCIPGRTSDADIVRLAVYNAGYGRVKEKWLPKDGVTPMAVEDITYPSTRSYIRQILSRREHYRQKGNFRKSVGVEPSKAG